MGYNLNQLLTVGIPLSIEKFTKFTKHLDITILYDKNLSLSFIDVAESLFRTAHIHDLDESIQKRLQTHLLVLCITAESLKQPSLKTVLSSFQRIATVVLTPDHTDISLYKAALSLQALHLNPFPTTEEAFLNELVKILPSLIKKNNDSIIEGHHRNIVEHSAHMYAIVNNGKTIYSNESYKKHFAPEQSVEGNGFIGSKEIADTLKKPSPHQALISHLGQGMDKASEFIVTTHTIRENESLLSITPLKISLHNCEKRLLNRMNFIEILKDAFVIHGSENESIPVVMIHIENSQKIILDSGENVYNDICKELLVLTRNYFNSESTIAQWHKDVYTIFSPGSTIEELKLALEEFHKDVTNKISFNGFALVLDTFVIDMYGIDLNKAIGIIDHIHQKHLLSTEISNLVFHEISGKDCDLEDKNKVLFYMEKLMLNKAPIKLLNFYKGIRINTSARLVKLVDGMAYLAIEKIQGYAMKLENHTVIQSSSIPFDLQSTLKIVDIGKKIAVLTNFTSLKVSANSRQHIRIQSDHRMHVTLSVAKSVMSGTIMDISIKSIACRISGSKIPIELDSSATLQFQLPIQGDGEMTNMVVEGKIQYVQTLEEFTKVVVILDLQEPYESYLIEYIYKRQQALVNELKNIANKL